MQARAGRVGRVNHPLGDVGMEGKTVIRQERSQREFVRSVLGWLEKPIGWKAPRGKLDV